MNGDTRTQYVVDVTEDPEALPFAPYPLFVPPMPDAAPERSRQPCTSVARTWSLSTGPCRQRRSWPPRSQRGAGARCRSTSTPGSSSSADSPETDHDTLEEMAERVAEGRVLLWEDDRGQVVHLTGHNLPAFGVAWIGPVYTPPEHRGRGYASAAVAGVSRRLLDQQIRVCLFTDQANPPSNGIYTALGFEPVVDMANLVVR